MFVPKSQTLAGYGKAEWLLVPVLGIYTKRGEKTFFPENSLFSTKQSIPNYLTINQSHFITKVCKTRDWKEPHGGRKSTRLWIQTNLGANPDLKQVTLPTLLNEQHWLEAQCWGHCWPCVGTIVAVALRGRYGFRYYKRRLQGASSERNRAPVGPLKSRQNPALSECTGKIRASLLMKALARSAPSAT